GSRFGWRDNRPLGRATGFEGLPVGEVRERNGRGGGEKRDGDGKATKMSQSRLPALLKPLPGAPPGHQRAGQQTSVGYIRQRNKRRRPGARNSLLLVRCRNCPKSKPPAEDLSRPPSAVGSWPLPYTTGVFVGRFLARSTRISPGASSKSSIAEASTCSFVSVTRLCSFTSE